MVHPHQDGRAPTFEWLVLAAGGPAVELQAITRGEGCGSFPRSRFAALLERTRPRIALLDTPPGGPAEMQLLAWERRRRHGLRIVQLAAPEAVDTRLDALRLGFDDALLRGHDHDGDPRTIDVHVRWLRSKIETEPERPVYLRTVRGVGYRLDPPGR